MELTGILSGLLTGLVVGMTGVGGGAIMTPLLILLMGVAPQTAVGTDLLFATITKLIAVKVHGDRGTVDWIVVRRLLCGSIPAACAVVAILHFSPRFGSGASGVIVPAVGIALVITAAAMLLKRQIHSVGRALRLGNPQRFKRFQPAFTVIAGFVLGVLVALTSIGAGALGAVLLLYLYPLRLTPAKLVGTDIAHAVPVALVAGIGHLALGNVDFQLLGWLLAGSLPGVWVGSRISVAAPAGIVRGALGLVLLLVGVRMLV